MIFKHSLIQTTYRCSVCQTHISKRSPEMPDWFILECYHQHTPYKCFCTCLQHTWFSNPSMVPKHIEDQCCSQWHHVDYIRMSADGLKLNRLKTGKPFQQNHVLLGPCQITTLRLRAWALN